MSRFQVAAVQDQRDLTPRPLSTGQPTDPADLLPPRPGEILIALRDRASDLHGGTLRLSDEIAELRTDHHRIRTRLATT